LYSPPHLDLIGEGGQEDKEGVRVKVDTRWSMDEVKMKILEAIGE